MVEVLVVSTRPLNFDFILGMNGVRIFNGVTIRVPNDVRFGVDSTASVVATVASNVIEEKDFTVTVLWKWSDITKTPCLANTTSEYKVRPEARQEYECELVNWLVSTI